MAGILTSDKINEKNKNVQYPIRGRLHVKAVELKRQLQAGVQMDFDYVLHLNYGDCHAFGQPAITLVRQVMSLCLMPSWLDRDDFPEDVKERVRHILSGCNGAAIGAYSDACGNATTRQDIATYIEERDGIPANFQDIFITAGATDAIRGTTTYFLQTSKNEKPAGFLIPVPTFAAYTASISIAHAYPIRYYLDEDAGWALNIDELRRVYDESLDKCLPRVLCVVNPGNPTGTVAYLADEVYQLNVYHGKFYSFRKVAHDMGAPYSEMEIASLNSASKGYTGECGLRAGYVELFNISTDVKDYFTKYIYCKSCSPTIGQACLSALVRPPKEHEPSYALYKQETTAIHESLKERAALLSNLFNSIEGIKCSPVSAALYAYPRIYIPPRAIEHARSLNIEPDEFYCEELLDKTGICVVPGSGFGQKAGLNDGPLEQQGLLYLFLFTSKARTIFAQRAL